MLFWSCLVLIEESLKKDKASQEVSKHVILKCKETRQHRPPHPPPQGKEALQKTYIGELSGDFPNLHWSTIPGFPYLLPPPPSQVRQKLQPGFNGTGSRDRTYSKYLTKIDNSKSRIFYYTLWPVSEMPLLSFQKKSLICLTMQKMTMMVAHQ